MVEGVKFLRCKHEATIRAYESSGWARAEAIASREFEIGRTTMRIRKANIGWRGVGPALRVIPY